MRTTHEARGKGSSASLAGLTVSPFCEGVSQLQSPSAVGLLWASTPPFQSLTPSTGRLPRPYSSAECTPQQSGSLLFPVQQLFPPSRSPLPRLSWADPDLLWDHLKKQDSHRLAPETDLKRRHPGITATMRSILLDWMLEASCCPSPSPPSLPPSPPPPVVSHRCVRSTGCTERPSTSPWTSTTASWTRSTTYPRRLFKRLASLVYLQQQRLRCAPNTALVSVACDLHFLPNSGNISTKG